MLHECHDNDMVGQRDWVCKFMIVSISCQETRKRQVWVVNIHVEVIWVVNGIYLLLIRIHETTSSDLTAVSSQATAKSRARLYINVD